MARAGLFDGISLAHLLRWCLALALTSSVLIYVLDSLHWMFILDAPIIRYVNFLIDHGFSPYREVTDNNWPGAYLADRAATFIFGSSDLSWRLFDFSLLLAISVAMTLIAWPYDRMAGFMAGALFCLQHGVEGAINAGQRDEIMTALILVGFAAAVLSTRHDLPALQVGAGFAVGWATMIKPTAVMFLPALLILVFGQLAGRRRACWNSVLTLCSGFGIAIVVVVCYLLAHDSLAAFLHVQFVTTRFYAGLRSLTLVQTIKMLFYLQSPFVLPFLGVAVILYRRPLRRNWEWLALSAGTFVALLSYMLQRKGFLHHRYIFLAFIFLGASVTILRATRREGWRGWVARSGVIYVCAVLAPYYALHISSILGVDPLQVEMQADLESYGGASQLQHEVLCLDLVYGCLNALYHEHLIESVPLSGDLLVLSPLSSPAVDESRAVLWRQLQQHLPKLIIVSNENFYGSNGYDKLSNWPSMCRLIRDNYRLSREMSLAKWQPGNANPGGYRVYKRDGPG